MTNKECDIGQMRSSHVLIPQIRVLICPRYCGFVQTFNAFFLAVFCSIRHHIIPILQFYYISFISLCYHHQVRPYGLPMQILQTFTASDLQICSQDTMKVFRPIKSTNSRAVTPPHISFPQQLLERTIFDLSTCMAHISACIKANFKNYMRFGKDFSSALI